MTHVDKVEDTDDIIYQMAIDWGHASQQKWSAISEEGVGSFQQVSKTAALQAVCGYAQEKQ